MKVGRYLLILIIGAIIGGIFGGLLGSSIFKQLITSVQFANHSTVIVLTIITLLINIVLLIVLFRTQRKSLYFKNKLDEDIDDDRADYYEKKSKAYFFRVSVIYSILISVSLVHMFIIVLGHGTEYDSLLAIIPFLVASIAGIIIGFYYRKFDPRFPKQGEKNYTDKIFNLMDEGEKHISFVSMYKVYHWNLMMLMIGTMFLGIYSMATGINQGLSILILIIIFMYNAFGYLVKVRKFYKN